MSDAVLLAIIGVVLAVVNGVLVVAVGQWADARRKRAEAVAAAQATTQTATVAERVAEQSELAKVRMEYLGRIERLEKRLDDKDQEIRALTKDLGAANVTIAQQAARIADLEADLASLHKERAS